MSTPESKNIRGPAGADGKSPYIGADGYWYEWSDLTGGYVKTSTQAQGPQGPAGTGGGGGSGKSPYIGEDGYWYQYDDTTGEYVQAGVAQGPQGAQGPAGAASTSGYVMWGNNSSRNLVAANYGIKPGNSKETNSANLKNLLDRMSDEGDLSGLWNSALILEAGTYQFAEPIVINAPVSYRLSCIVGVGSVHHNAKQTILHFPNISDGQTAITLQHCVLKNVQVTAPDTSYNFLIDRNRTGTGTQLWDESGSVNATGIHVLEGSMSMDNVFVMHFKTGISVEKGNMRLSNIWVERAHYGVIIRNDVYITDLHATQCYIGLQAKGTLAHGTNIRGDSVVHLIHVERGGLYVHGVDADYCCKSIIHFGVPNSSAQVIRNAGYYSAIHGRSCVENAFALTDGMDAENPDEYSFPSDVANKYDAVAQVTFEPGIYYGGVFHFANVKSANPLDSTSDYRCPIAEMYAPQEAQIVGAKITTANGGWAKVTDEDIYAHHIRLDNTQKSQQVKGRTIYNELSVDTGFGSYLIKRDSSGYHITNAYDNGTGSGSGSGSTDADAAYDVTSLPLEVGSWSNGGVAGTDAGWVRTVSGQQITAKAGDIISLPTDGRTVQGIRILDGTTSKKNIWGGVSQEYTLESDITNLKVTICVSPIPSGDTDLTGWIKLKTPKASGDTGTGTEYDDTELRRLIAAKYTKPADGIPKTDLSAEVQGLLESGGGISKSDVILTGSIVPNDDNYVSPAAATAALDAGKTVILTYEDETSKTVFSGFAHAASDAYTGIASSTIIKIGGDLIQYTLESKVSDDGTSYWDISTNVLALKSDIPTGGSAEKAWELKSTITTTGVHPMPSLETYSEIMIIGWATNTKGDGISCASRENATSWAGFITNALTNGYRSIYAIIERSNIPGYTGYHLKKGVLGTSQVSSLASTSFSSTLIVLERPAGGYSTINYIKIPDTATNVMYYIYTR